MTTSERIRSLAQDGFSVAEIARRLDIRYQHAYKVCRDAGLTRMGAEKPSESLPAAKPRLTADRLLQNGFERAGCWVVSGDVLIAPPDLPKCGGVYAFARSETVLYVGLASRSLRQRVYFYGKPGPSQRTNIRLNESIRSAIAEGATVEVLFALSAEVRVEWLHDLRCRGAGSRPDRHVRSALERARGLTTTSESRS